jgi:hypothetical protein
LAVENQRTKTVRSAGMRLVLMIMRIRMMSRISVVIGIMMAKTQEWQESKNLEKNSFTNKKPKINIKT